MKILHPNHGDCRSKKKFLFFPKRINYETRWLEVAKWSEVYKEFNPYTRDRRGWWDAKEWEND